ncbi:MAG: Gfo/Idh/MocA family oxidoreductase [Armatimonadetes bacterium]|nr:Gfo/Idh/MocA family oxidoreductase [Armatimonadota bacterium]
MVRFGVVGAGWFASRRHLPELAQHPEVELVALCRRSPEPLRKLAEHFGVRQQYTDYQDMLARAELDAVLVCSTHDLHHEHAAAALQAGCHVLLEKPMAITAADAADLVSRAEAAGKLLEVAYNPPFWKHTCYLRERLAAGDLGAVEAVDLRWTGDVQGVFGRDALPDNMPGVVAPTLFRGNVAANGGGHLIDSGSHQVCEAMWVTGEAMTSIAAQMDSVPDDMRFSLSFRLSGGGLGSIVSIGDSKLADRRTVNTYYGSEATVVVRGMPFEVTWLRPRAEAEVVTEAAMPEAPQPVVAFVDALFGRAEPRCPGRDCVGYVAAIEAAYRAAATGQTQNLGPQ